MDQAASTAMIWPRRLTQLCHIVSMIDIIIEIELLFSGIISEFLGALNKRSA